MSPKSSLGTLQEQCQVTTATNSHVVLQLEHAQSLLSQFSEGYAEVLPWLQETEALIGQFTLNTISYEAFREQQDLLQVLNNLHLQSKALTPLSVSHVLQVQHIGLLDYFRKCIIVVQYSVFSKDFNSSFVFNNSHSSFENDLTL